MFETAYSSGLPSVSTCNRIKALSAIKYNGYLYNMIGVVKKAQAFSYKIFSNLHAKKGINKIN